MIMLRYLLTLLVCASLLTGCAKDQQPVEVAPPFEMLDGEVTGLHFRNELEMSREFNVFNYMYFYNGGGLAAADFDRDGRIDLFFTSNMGSNKLYLNQGDFRFRDVTQAAGMSGQPGWTTGASVVDINNDGLLDIYVSQVGNYLVLQGSNQLYINQGVKDGVPVFRDEAAAYGLDLVGFGTQGAFFDYDGDGDLDLFQLNHSLHQNGTFGKREEKGAERHPLAGDRLMRNDGDQFTDVSEAAGIRSSAVGYGLGVAVGDINNDGWPDLYIGNDFHENDYLYLNQRDGTFREALTEQMQHTSRFSMGVDIGDINQDGHAEIISLDMLPEDPNILKRSLGEDGFDVFRFKLGFGYNPQFSRNTLQLNNGDGTFSEIGAFAGVYATDWSWSPLLVDWDLDGRRDLFVSNGIPRRMNDIDYINFKTNDNLKYREAFNDIRDRELDMVEKMPEIRLRNKFLRNAGDLTFTDQTSAVRNDRESYSGAAVAADLDNDGDPDLVVNNIDDEAFVYRNLARSAQQRRGGEDAGAVLSIQLRGSQKNREAIGATAIVFRPRGRQVVEHYPVRGYQSSMLGPLQVSLGPDPVDSIVLVWPDRTYERVELSSLDTAIVREYGPGLPPFDFTSRALPPPPPLPLTDITDVVGLDHYHRENPFVDFNRETLIPHMVSTEGPALTVGDVNGDGREDFFVGSAKRERSALYRQNADGSFTDITPVALIQDSVFEDVDALFTDLNGDGAPDLVVASGGNEYEKRQEPRLQRTYLNDGRSGFVRQNVLPEIYATAARVVSADFNGDGRQDLFLAGRVVPKNYGVSPESYLLRQEADGQFTDVTDELAPDLRSPGMVTDAHWADLDNDGDADLLIALEWGHVLAYYNEPGGFVSRRLGEPTGWWRSLTPLDYDGDGDLDILAGNLGTNNKLRPTPEQPLRMYVNDYDENGTLDQILTYYVGGIEIPFANHAELTKQLPPLKKQYIYAQDMARVSLEELFGREKLAAADRFEVTTLASVLFEQLPDGSFTTHPLPDVAQFSSIHAASATADPSPGLLFGGNFLGANIEMGWYDAGRLRALTFPGGQPEVRELSGSPIGGEIRRIVPIRIGSRTAYLIGRNNDRLLVVGVEE